MREHFVAPVRVNPVLKHAAERRTQLSGKWTFRLDPEDVGKAEGWHKVASNIIEGIVVPGCWQGQGFGGDEKDMIRDFSLEARVYKATYKGTGWYARRFRPDATWRGGRLWLLFGGAYPTAEVWLNGTRLGVNHDPFVPFGFEVGESVRFDEENLLVVRISEEDRLFGYVYSFQGNWSGLFRDVELTATGQTCIRQLRLYPELGAKSIRAELHLDGWDGKNADLTLAVAPADGAAPAQTHAFSITKDTVSAEGRFACAVDVPNPQLWSPDAPNLYRVEAVLKRGDEVLDAQIERTGFVALAADGPHFRINGEAYYMRGDGGFEFYPETGSPDTNRERLRKKLMALRAYGYNYIRCQSYAPIPEYMEVADEVGLLVQGEMGAVGPWGGISQWHTYNWPEVCPSYSPHMRRQWNRVVERDVNHPSANMYCMSNERSLFLWPRTAWQCYHETKALKPTALVIWTDGGWNESLPQDFVNWEPASWEEDKKRIGKLPIIQHEYRWWSSFPDISEVARFNGAVRQFAVEIAVEAASKHGIAHTLAVAARNSQRLQFAEAKGKMEQCRRDYPYLAGINHFSAVDVPSSPQGILNVFYERKHAAAAEWLQTNGDTVVLSSLGFDNRVLASEDSLEVVLSVSDFSHPGFKRPAIQWRFSVDGKECQSGVIHYDHQAFVTCQAGSLRLSAPQVQRPLKAELEAVLSEQGRAVRNSWDLWVFPKHSPLPAKVACYGARKHTWLRDLQGLPEAGPERLDPTVFPVVLAERMDAPLAAFLKAGGKVILAASEGLLFQFNPKGGLVVGRYFFTPPANYPPFESGHCGTIIKNHSMLGDFIHEGWADLQFYRMMADSAAMELIPLGLNDKDPVIRVMHAYPVGRSLGYLAECRFGRGGMILSSLDLNQKWPEAQHLLARICSYAAGKDFAPEIELSQESLDAIATLTELP